MSATLRNRRILVVDDEAAMRDVLVMRIEGWGCDVRAASGAAEAAAMVREELPDLVLCDVVLPEESGIDLLRRLSSEGLECPVVLLTAHGTVEMAVDAVKEGAADFLTKPINYESLKLVIAEACRDRDVMARSREAVEEEAQQGFGPFIGISRQMQDFYGLIRDVARSDASVLITGESGTGKELAARTIHDLSRRRERAFVALNSAAIPRDLVESELFGHQKGAFTGATTDRAGCFEMADGGTLFLDEIAEMPAELQPKLLRVLDEARFRRVGGRKEITADVRTLAATNRQPHEAVREELLREDLYYRLNVLAVEIPPLRQREGDIAFAARVLLRSMGTKHGSQAQAYREDTVQLLEAYSWPGNFRELKNVVERAAVFAKGEWIEPSHLPAYVRDPGVRRGPELVIPPGMTVAEVEREMILQTLEETGNNKAAAARRLGINEKTVRNKLKAYQADETRP